MTEIGERAKVPEIPLNRTLVNMLKSVDQVLGTKGDSPLQVSESGISLRNGDTVLATISESDVQVVGESFEERITTRGSDSITSPFEARFNDFLETVSDRIVRLNHLGISYVCDDIAQETERLKNLTAQRGVPLSQEPSTDPEQKWLFLGDVNNLEDPLFEVVLNKDSDSPPKPHFQIDIDTTLSVDEIKKITDEKLGVEFVQWQLDIPDYGTVLTMGTLGEVNSTQIALGIGTDKRGTEYHRKNELKPM